MRNTMLNKLLFSLMLIPVSVSASGQEAVSNIVSSKNQVTVMSRTYLSEREFLSPSVKYKPQIWWHWSNGHISKEAITKDLESFVDGGFGGFTLFNSSEGMPLAGPVDYMSEEWFEMLRHTGREAKRLGLEMGVCNGSGWSVSGGPWVDPDQAMQEVVWTEKQVKGPLLLDEQLEIPLPALGLERDMQKNAEINRRYYVSRDRVKGYYRDIVVLAFPTPKADVGGTPFRIKDWWGKSGFHKYSPYTPDQREPGNENIIDPEQLIDITEYLTSDGKLQWKVPSGEWTILRLGYQPTGRQNHPAVEKGRGLEINKLSSEAVRYYWDHSTGRMIDALEKAAPGVAKFVLIDSYEAGHQNWTPGFEREFRERRGYDLLSYLPALTGRVVKNMEYTEKFLWDFRKTISDLLAESFYGTMAQLCHERGLFLAAEPYGNFGNTNDFTVAGYVDLPMNEWWAERYDENPMGEAKLVSSAAHTYGRTVVGAEAFTGDPNRIFETSPRNYKAQGDYFFSEGINQFSLHTFVHDPYEVAPGLGLGGYGTRFDRRNTWWPYINGWTEYLSRCQYLLQLGKSVNDFLYYTGEDAPLTPLSKLKLNPIPPEGYDYDFCNSEIFQALRVVDGVLQIPGGQSYKALIMPDQKHMSLPVLRKVEQLLMAGAIIIGSKPLRLPNMGTTESEQEFSSLVERIWSNCDGKTVKKRRYEAGTIFTGISLKEVAEWQMLLPDFSVRLMEEEPSGKLSYPVSGIKYIHRKMEGADIYFVTNQYDVPKRVEATFRVDHQLPELWYPEDGRTEVATTFSQTTDGRTKMFLDLKPTESVFVVFKSPLHNEIAVTSYLEEEIASKVKFVRKDNNIWMRSKEAVDLQVEFSDGSYQNVSMPTSPEAIELVGPWKVSFPNKKKTLNFPCLTDWTKHEQQEIRNYSGSALYSISFRVNAEQLQEGTKCYLNLGDVEVVSEVFLNGKTVGILWKSPYELDVTEYIREGKNQLEVKVANLWVNRLIGDEELLDSSKWTNKKGTTLAGMALEEIPQWVIEGRTPPSSHRQTFVAWKWPHLKGKELLPSGLIGPVRLVFERGQIIYKKE